MNDNIELLDGIVVFTTVVETGGFSAAAKKLRRSVSYVSKNVTRLEARLKVRLLHRTTRTVVPTDSGKAYYERCRQIVAAARETEQDLVATHRNPQGHLRVSMPVSFGHSYLDDTLPDFLEAYPDITVNAELNDHLVDVVAEGFDVVIRAGKLEDSSLVARRLMTSRIMTVASPDYLARHGTPQKPVDLEQHNCISSSRVAVAQWTFVGPDKTPIGLDIKSRIISNSSQMQLPMAVNGVGITQLPHFICYREIQSGELVPILTDYEKDPISVYAVYPNRAHLSAKVRVFVDFLVKTVG